MVILNFLLFIAKVLEQEPAIDELHAMTDQYHVDQEWVDAHTFYI